MKEGKEVFKILSITLILFSIIALLGHNIVKQEKKAVQASIQKEKLKQKKEKKKAIKDEYKNIEKVVLKAVGKYEDKIGLVYYNLETGTKYSLNEDKNFISASVKKLPMVMSAADDIQDNKLSKDKLLSYNRATDYEEGTGILQGRTSLNSIKTEEAMKLSIIYSDNIAYNILKDYTSIYVYDYIEKNTGIKTEIRGNMTAEQSYLILRKLYENKDNNPYYNKIIEWMKETPFNERIAREIPNEEVAHKIGTNMNCVHDIGIIYAKNPYILVVMTEDTGIYEEKNRPTYENGTYADPIISDISKNIYKVVESIN